MAPFITRTGSCVGQRSTYVDLDDAAGGACQRLCWERQQAALSDLYEATRCVADRSAATDVRDAAVNVCKTSVEPRRAGGPMRTHAKTQLYFSNCLEILAAVFMIIWSSSLV